MAEASNIGMPSEPTQRGTPILRRALGLMSGTSLDGIDVALIATAKRQRVAADDL